MAENKKNRKSSRHFNLEKPVERSFVIEKDADILAATPTKPEDKTQPAAPIAPIKKQEDVKNPSAQKFDLSKDSEEVNLEELKKELLADGKLDAEEVDKLRGILYADGKIDQEEADFVFELNDAVSGKENDPTWNQFFVQTISDYLLKDEKSPGVIDEDEGKWLVEKIGADGKVDGVEKQLLNHLKQNAKKIPASVEALLKGNGDTIPPGPEKTNSKKWKWLIPAAIVVAAVPSYFLFTGNGDSDPDGEQIVMNSSMPSQGNANDDAAASNATGENSNSENVDNSAGSDDVGDSGSTENAGNSDNTDTGSSSPEVGSGGNSPSGAKGSTQPSAGQSSSNNNKPNSGSSVLSTTTTNSSNDKVGSTGLSSGQGKSVSNNSENARTKATPVIPGSIEQKALDVIRGVFGNGQERKDKLGAEYTEIQKRVNEMYRNGLVH